MANKKRKITSIEILGAIGLAMWVAIAVLRRVPMANSPVYHFALGVLPNWGAAWAATMVGKWILTGMGKLRLTMGVYLGLCAGVLLIAVLSEVFFYLFWHRAFDVYDLLVTVVAQTLMFFIPLWAKNIPAPQKAE